MLESSDADATELKTGWKASLETVARWPVSVWRAGSLGTQSAADRLDAGAMRADESSSSSWAFFASRSITFFCSPARTMSRIVTERSSTHG